MIMFKVTVKWERKLVFDLVGSIVILWTGQTLCHESFVLGTVFALLLNRQKKWQIEM